MGVRIYCNNQEILDVRNLTFGYLHESIVSLLNEKNIEISSSIENLLEKMDQRIYGVGAICADIADYLK